jgi:tRNA pseudouridine55 synthase
LSSEQGRGLILLDKPPGVTSFGLLGPVKSALGTRQVGHAGTLDRFATGLLLVLTGRLTRLVELFSELDKSYRAMFRFGSATDTLDPEGEVLQRAGLPELERVEEGVRRLTGEMEQLPPVYSAVHVEGHRAYRIARRGERPALKPRRVVVHRMAILAYEPPDLEVEIDCSKGTYVRALARDLGSMAGSCAHVRSLRRTRIGPFRVEEAVPPDRFLPDRDLHPPAEFLGRLADLRVRTLRPERLQGVLRGEPLQDGSFTAPPDGDGLYAAFSPDRELVAVAAREGGTFRYRAVFGDR